MPSHKTEDMVSPTSAREESEDSTVPAIRVRGPPLEQEGPNTPDEAYETSSERGGPSGTE